MSNNPEHIIAKRQQRKILGACASCAHAKEDTAEAGVHGIGVPSCAKSISTFKKKQCAHFLYYRTWAG